MAAAGIFDSEGNHAKQAADMVFLVITWFADEFLRL